MIKKIIFGFIIASNVCGTAGAQESSDYNEKIISAYSDSLLSLRRKITGSKEFENKDLNPYFYRLVGPATYYSSSVRGAMRMDWQLPSQREVLHSSSGMLYRDRICKEVDASLIGMYVNSPARIGRYDAMYMNENIIEQKSGKLGKDSKDLETVLDDVKGIEDVTEVIEDVDINIKVTRPNFWKTDGNFSLQFTQNYFSENWYKGGNNNGTMLASLILHANYNDQRYIQWDNKLEMRLGFVTTTSDSCHTFLTNNDKLNLYSKLGVKAAKSWFYTVSLEANTQFMPGYRSNDRRMYSKFLAPLDVYLSVGMDFKPSLKNGNSLSVALLPLSYKFRYIGTDDDNIHSVFQIGPSGFRQNFGSKVEVNSSVKILNNFSWRCRFYYFTSYEYAESELENVFSFAFSKYIKSELYTLWRFDDSRSKAYYDDNLGFFQFKEYLTLGLSYSF